MSPQPSMIQAAVMIPLYRTVEGAVRLVLIRRSEGGTHGGHLAFPGGKQTATDASLWETALRETEEEIGLTPDRVEQIETLPPTNTRTTGFQITPFLARIRPPAQWQPDPREVAEVIEIDVAELAHPDAHQQTIAQFRTWLEPETIHYYRVGSHRLWGVSYRIFHPILPRLVAGEWDI